MHASATDALLRAADSNGCVLQSQLSATSTWNCLRSDANAARSGSAQQHEHGAHGMVPIPLALVQYFTHQRTNSVTIAGHHKYIQLQLPTPAVSGCATSHNTASLRVGSSLQYTVTRASDSANTSVSGGCADLMVCMCLHSPGTWCWRHQTGAGAGMYLEKKSRRVALHHSVCKDRTLLHRTSAEA